MDKKPRDWQGIPIIVEVEAGGTRSGTDREGRSWNNQIEHHYGYVAGSVSMEEGEGLDIIVHKDWQPSDSVYFFDLMSPSGEFLEEKVFAGFPNEKVAAAACSGMYFFATIEFGYKMSVEDFSTYLAMRLGEAEHKVIDDDPNEVPAEQLDESAVKSLTRKTLTQCRSLRKKGVLIGKETIAGRIARMDFSVPGLGVGSVVSSPLLKDVYMIKLDVTGPSVGSVVVKGPSPQEAYDKAEALAKSLRDRGLWNTEKHRLTGKETPEEVEAKRNAWMDEAMATV